MQDNFAGWIEIPVKNMERAISFYEKVLGIKLDRNQMGPLDMAWFPFNPDSYGSGGSLVHYPNAYKPSADGVLIYLTAHSGDLSNELARIEEAAGKVLQNKTQISKDHGFMAL